MHGPTPEDQNPAARPRLSPLTFVVLAGILVALVLTALGLAV